MQHPFLIGVHSSLNLRQQLRGRDFEGNRGSAFGITTRRAEHFVGLRQQGTAARAMWVHRNFGVQNECRRSNTHRFETLSKAGTRG